MYKAEFFDTEFNYKSSAMFETEELSLDYITLDATTITVPKKISVAKGDLAHITGNIIFDGVVADVRPKKQTLDIAIRPLQAILDIEVLAENISDVSTFLEKAIKDGLISNADVLQNMPINLRNNVPTGTRPYQLDGYKAKLIEVMTSALTTYEIAVNCNLNMKNKTIDVSIEQVTEVVTIETDLSNVIDQEITLGDSYGGCNKAIIRKIVTENTVTSVRGTTTFFLHTDGTISTADTNRISPVFFIIEEMEDTATWERDALAKAAELLMPQKFDNEINLTFLEDDKVSHPKQIRIGTTTKIYVGKTVYLSILTGKIFSQGIIKLMFGNVRVDLTKKLILERRKRQ